MINKIYKSINNKYQSLFKFIFFLRYLIGIFFISLFLFLFIPNFFDYSKKEETIKSYLIKGYGLHLNNFKSIKFNSLPRPNLEIQNANLDLNSKDLKFNTKKLNIYLRLIDIYNFDNFESKKIVFHENNIILDVENLKTLSDYFDKLKNKLTFKNLKLEIKKKNNSLIDLKKINFSNYGYKKDIIEGEIFNRRFKATLKNNFQEINFKLLNTGIDIKIDLLKKKENALVNGNLKAKILKSNLKFNFEYNDKILKINNLFFRNKDLSFNSENTITHQPFFNFTSSFIVRDFNPKILNDINFIKLFKSKKIIKKINSKNVINFESKKFSKNLVENLDLNINLAYGRLVYSNRLIIAESEINCMGDLNFLEEYPKLNFNCSLNSKDKKKLLKKFLVKYKKKNEKLNLIFKGSLNILNNTINFQNIEKGNNYQASEEDLKYFKDTFETLVFKKDFSNIFKLEKIKMFILEIL